MSLPSPRPELSHLLLEAIRRRDAATVARLTGQWAHRHGVTSLESFRTGSVVAEAGWEAGDWLLQHMDAAMAPASVTMAEAFAALEDSFSGPPQPAPITAVPAPITPVPAPITPVPSPVTPIRAVPEPSDTVTVTAKEPVPAPPCAVPVVAAEGAAGLSDVIALHPQSPSASPAPAPSTLADLRSWLSAAPQHRLAS